MKKTLFLLCSILFINYASAQPQFTECFNGKKDSTEDGIDCGIHKPGCIVCNGEARIVLNGKNYATGAIQTFMSEQESPTIFLDKSKANTTLICHFYTEGTRQSGVTLYFYFRGKLNKPVTYKINSLTSGPFGLNIMNNRSSSMMPLHHVKEGTINITSIDPIERKMTADFTIQAKLADGTPVDLKGSFINVGF